jgi:hypothetical protein
MKYGHVTDTGFMLFVDAKSSIHSLNDLGISISGDSKAATSGQNPGQTWGALSIPIRAL